LGRRRRERAADDLPGASSWPGHDRASWWSGRAGISEVAVLGNDTPMASVPGEVCYAGEWYDYETKYGAGQTTFKVPAPLPPATTELIRTLAIKAFQAVDCAGMARVDFFVEAGGRVLVNEINTIPGSQTAYPLGSGGSPTPS
jgi:D-alanine--D-alanine ligase